jgi:uncharacterized protein (DUF1330 family)
VTAHLAVATLTVTDPGWVAAYVAEVTPMVERHGGRYLTRTTRLTEMEGDGPAPQVLLVIAWPSREAAERFHASEEYRPHREARRRGSRGAFWLVPAEDVNRIARVVMVDL